MNGEICRGYGLNRGSKQTVCGNYVNPSTCGRSWNTARNFIVSQMRSYLKLLFEASGSLLTLQRALGMWPNHGELLARPGFRVLG